MRIRPLQVYLERDELQAYCTEAYGLQDVSQELWQHGARINPFGPA